jgi:hypothetical protein
MARATIPKPVLDSLIRAKLADLQRCAGIRPLPVSWVPSHGSGCNWTIPGWSGDARLVQECTGQMGPYLELLKSQFNIPEEQPCAEGPDGSAG